MLEIAFSVSDVRDTYKVRYLAYVKISNPLYPHPRTAKIERERLELAKL